MGAPYWPSPAPPPPGPPACGSCSRLSKLGVWGACFSGAVFKSQRHWKWGLNPSLLKEQLGGRVSSRWRASVGVGFVVRVCPRLSYLFPWGPSLIAIPWSLGVTSQFSVFVFLDLRWGRELKSSDLAILNQDPLVAY